MRVKTRQHNGISDIDNNDLTLRKNLEGQQSIPVIVGDAQTQSLKWAQHSVTLDGTSKTVARMLVNQSNLTVWKHSVASTLLVQKIQFNYATGSAFDGTVELGWLSSVTTLTGTLTALKDLDLGVSKEELLEYDFNGGVTPDSLFGKSTAALTAFQTDTTIKAGDNIGYPSGDGDLVAYISGQTTITNSSIALDILVGYKPVIN